VLRKLKKVCMQYYRIQESKFAFEIIETDPKIGLVHGAGGKYNLKNKFVIKINEAGSAVLKVGKEGPKRHHGAGMIMLMDTLVDSNLQAKLVGLGKKFKLADLEEGKVLISLDTTESIAFGGAGGGSFPGPGSNFIRVSGLNRGDGYYIRLPKAYEKKALLSSFEEYDAAACEDMGEAEEKSLSDVLQLSTDLTFFTSSHHCMGSLKPPGGGSEGTIEYTFRLKNKDKILEHAWYRPPGTYNEGNEFIRDCTQGVCVWSTGTFLPVPLAVGEMLDDKKTDVIEFDVYANYAGSASPA
jgi:hypothetical protein